MARLQPRPRLWEPGRQFPGAWLHQASVLISSTWCCGNFTGQWLGLTVLKPFYFCIKGGEAFFFSGLYLHFPNQKCPNQTGQVVTGNHSSKVFFFFFFHFFLKPHVEGKLTKCRLAALYPELTMLSAQMEQSGE